MLRKGFNANQRAEKAALRLIFMSGFDSQISQLIINTLAVLSQDHGPFLI